LYKINRSRYKKFIKVRGLEKKSNSLLYYSTIAAISSGPIVSPVVPDVLPPQPVVPPVLPPQPVPRPPDGPYNKLDLAVDMSMNFPSLFNLNNGAGSYQLGSGNAVFDDTFYTGAVAGRDYQIGTSGGVFDDMRQVKYDLVDRGFTLPVGLVGGAGALIGLGALAAPYAMSAIPFTVSYGRGLIKDLYPYQRLGDFKIE